MNRTQIPDWVDRVGSGWHPILSQLHTDARALDHNYSVDQIKEKFGELRVYLTSTNPQVFLLVTEATARSQKICEDCGAAGHIQALEGKRWFRCVCNKCLETWASAN